MKKGEIKTFDLCDGINGEYFTIYDFVFFINNFDENGMITDEFLDRQYKILELDEWHNLVTVQRIK